ncbi:hypothetical protein QBC35DRAFT_492005 [Podospora australis]|uniref:Uncharacterized protein n=1 Tax=Podospora australis TaxID=1536484 RepID=A0AAN7AJV7_9PEZI|nr:hypothetical protein QBC35DRAFT_492005 [Podospora australis]
MGYIHACTLRWSLQREGKLRFSANLRLLTASRHSLPNSFIPNTIYLFGIMLAYGSTSLIFLSLNPELARLLDKKYKSDDTTGVHMNGIALLTLGAGFVLQAAFTQWALVGTKITTWSSNPLNVARACMVDEAEGYRVLQRQGRCMMSVHLAKEDAMALKPIPKQRPSITAHRDVRRVLYLLWALPILGGIWGGGIQGYLLRGSRNGILGRSWSLIPIFSGSTDTNCSAKQCTNGTSILNVGWSASNGTAGTFGGVLLIIALQSVVTLSLHCAELLVNLARDEKIYRKLIGPIGTNGHYNSIFEAFTSWETILLFTLKAGVHWVFGLAINMQFQLGVNMHPPQIFYFAGFSLIAAIFGLFLSLRKPKGPLPATYGHIQTIADIVDEWAISGCMFWGVKPNEPDLTGTSTHPLKMPDYNKFYGGQKDYSHTGPGVTVVEIPLDTFSPITPATPGSGNPFPDYPSPPPYNPYFAHQQQQTPPVQSFTQWTQQGQHGYAHDQPSYSSMNSRYSNQSGHSSYSAYSNLSAQPFLQGHRPY